MSFKFFNHTQEDSNTTVDRTPVHHAPVNQVTLEDQKQEGSQYYCGLCRSMQSHHTPGHHYPNPLARVRG